MPPIREHVPLATYTTLASGGVARFMVRVENEEALQEAVAFAAKQAVPYVVLGGGSNVLVSDEGFPGLVIVMAITGKDYEALSDTQVRLHVAAGESFDALIAETVQKNLWGLENLSHIPGSVGATAIQNVGAYGVEMAQLIESVRVFDTADSSFRELSAVECQFGYRDSLFKHEAGKGLIVVGLTILLSPKPERRLDYRDVAERFANSSPRQSEIRAAVINIRSKKFPDWTVVGTAGSFFKNPIIAREKFEELLARYPDLPHYELNEQQVKIPLGYVLDKICHLRGVREGHVGTYEGQALVIVNYGGATSKEIDSFAKKIEAKVFSETGILIEREVKKL